MAEIRVFISSVQAEFAQERLMLAEYIRRDAMLGRYFEPFLFKELPAYVNPVLANPVYLTGYIEQMGTGTTDIIDRCLSYGLRAPQFLQDNDFTTILWRPEKVEEEQVGEQVREQVREHEKDHETDHQIGHVTDHVKKLVLVIRGDTKTREEIMEVLQLRGRRNFIENYLSPAIELGYLSMLYPDKPNGSVQAYYLTPKGLELLKTLKEKK